jgi:hypothetical protein
MTGTSTRSYVLELPAGSIMGVLPRLVRGLQGALGMIQKSQCHYRRKLMPPGPLQHAWCFTHRPKQMQLLHMSVAFVARKRRVSKNLRLLSGFRLTLLVLFTQPKYPENNGVLIQSHRRLFSLHHPWHYKCSPTSEGESSTRSRFFRGLHSAKRKRRITP